MTNAWIVLVVSGVFECGWAVGLKYSDNFHRFWPSVATLAAMLVSLYGLSWALRTIPLGTGYAVWTGIGSVLTALVGIWLFGDSTAAARLACIGLIVAGIVGLKLFS